MSDPRLLAHRRPRRPHALLPARMHRLSRSCRLSLNLIGIGSSCLIPDFDGATFFVGWKEALWDEFFMAAPTTTGGA